MGLRPMRWILITACVATLCVGCDGNITPESQQLLVTGRSAYQSGDDAGAIRAMNQFLADNLRAKQTDEAYYFRGLARYRTKDLPGATADFHQVVTKTSSPQLKAMAYKGIADMAYDREDMALAESMYRNALSGLKDSERPADEVHYRLGRALQRLGRWEEADLQFSKVIGLFKGSELALRAGRLYNATVWTVQMAALKDKRSADSLAAKYRSENRLACTVQPIQADVGPMFAVQTGRFPTYDLAAAALGKIRPINPQAEVTVAK